MKKELSDEERQRLKAEFEALTHSAKLPDIEYDGQMFKVVRIGMNHKEAWPTIERIIKMGYHVVGVAGNSNNMNQGFVMLEHD